MMLFHVFSIKVEYYIINLCVYRYIADAVADYFFLRCFLLEFVPLR